MTTDEANEDREVSLSTRENQLRILMAVYALLYVVFGIVLLICPGGVLELINAITDRLGASTVLDIPSDPFWAIVTVSLLLLLAVMCYLAFLDVRRHLLLAWLMVFAKFASVASQLLYLAFSAGHPPGFAVGAIVDGFLGTLALVFLLRARPKKGDNGEAGEPAG